MKQSKRCDWFETYMGDNVMTLNTLDTQNASTQHIDVTKKNVLSHCTSWWYIMTFSEYNDNGKNVNDRKDGHR